MYDPAKRLGEEDGGGKGGKSPSVAVAVFDPKKRLGEDEPDGDEAKEPSDADAQMDQAVAGLCKAFNVSQSVAPKVRQYLEAFFHAADSKPHDEGEHTNESEGEEN